MSSNASRGTRRVKNNNVSTNAVTNLDLERFRNLIVTSRQNVSTHGNSKAYTIAYFCLILLKYTISRNYKPSAQPNILLSQPSRKNAAQPQPSRKFHLSRHILRLEPASGSTVSGILKGMTNNFKWRESASARFICDWVNSQA